MPEFEIPICNDIKYAIVFIGSYFLKMQFKDGFQ